jgi:glycerophosphoryl diester phosphodiesterase
MVSPPLLLGHRGARAISSVRENTFDSFDLALQHGCDGFEFDLRLTGCGRAVVCHDPKVGRIPVARANRRQLLDLPQFGDVLACYGQRVFLDIELKVRGLEPAVLDALRESRPARDYVVSSFLPAVLLELKARSAVVPLGIICQKQQQLARWHILPVEYVIAHQLLVKRKLVEDVHAAGRKLVIWTVNDAPSMLRLAEWGVDGIISDETRLLVRTLKPASFKAPSAPSVANPSRSKAVH